MHFGTLKKSYNIGLIMPCQLCLWEKTDFINRDLERIQLKVRVCANQSGPFGQVKSGVLHFLFYFPTYSTGCLSPNI